MKSKKQPNSLQAIVSSVLPKDIDNLETYQINLKTECETCNVESYLKRDYCTRGICPKE